MKNRYIEGLKYPNPHPFRKDTERMLDMFHTDTYIEDGVIRWKASQNIPPQDILDFWKFIGLDFNYEKTMEVHEKETAEFFKNYRKNTRASSTEEEYEMRAAFGEGVDVVDIISGKHYRT